ncbi:MAG: hypothetical protein PGN37_06535 [Mycobacterium kyogaense]|uniref:hypothetical protein n=1 Tax=Mycobacterium kyogaense TaxID=2212479 RepID=UPI002FF7C1E9
MLAKANPEVISTVHSDGQPLSAATWYLLRGEDILVKHGRGRKRLQDSSFAVGEAAGYVGLIEGRCVCATVTLIGRSALPRDARRWLGLTFLGSTS